MKIGIDISQIQYKGSGVATYTLELVRHLLALESQHEFVLYGGSLRQLHILRELTKDFQAKKIFLPLPNTVQDLMFNQRLGWPIEFFTGRVDVFHASDWTMPGSLGAKLVTTIHDLTVIKYPQHQHPKIIKTHQRRLERIKQLKPQIITDSHASKKDIVKHLGLRDREVEVIHLAASPDFSQFASRSRQEKSEAVAAVKTEFDLKQYLLFVGTSEPRKNVDAVIQAYAQVRESFPQLELVLVGKYGWGKDQRHGKGVKVLGYVDQDKLAPIYAGAQAFVYPSFYEGFGLPVLEAMTVGTPVVTSNKGSLAEVAGDGAVIVDPHDVVDISSGIISALSQPKKWRNKGLKQASQFSWDKAAKRTLDVYEKTF